MIYLHIYLLKKLYKLKNFRSSREFQNEEYQVEFPIDIPNKLRREFSHLLVAPLSNIINFSLRQETFPSIWKHKLVMPVPKCSEVSSLSQLRQISCSSDYSPLDLESSWCSGVVRYKLNRGPVGDRCDCLCWCCCSTCSWQKILQITINNFHPVIQAGPFRLNSVLKSKKV